MTKEEIKQFCLAECAECKLSKNNGSTFCCNDHSGSCEEVKMKYITAEIPMKSRWELCKTDEDFIRMIKEADQYCGKYNSEHECCDCELYAKCKNIGTLYSNIAAYCTEKLEVVE